MWGRLLVSRKRSEVDKMMEISQNHLHSVCDYCEDTCVQLSADATRRAEIISDLLPGEKSFRLRNHLLKNVSNSVSGSGDALFLVVSSSSMAGVSLYPKGQKLLRAHKEKSAPTAEDILIRKEKAARGPSLVSNFHLRRMEACLQAKFTWAKLNFSRG